MASPHPGELAIAGAYDGLDARIRCASKNWKSKTTKLSADFYYLTFRDSQPTVSDFVDYIYWRIIPFCLPRAERSDLERQFSETKDYKYLHTLSDKAKALFISAKESGATTGEPAELMLFILLEAFLKAPQLACKMYLKTNKNVPVHGADSIHLFYEPQSGELIIYWGESKLKKDIGKAFEKIFESITSFLEPKDGSAPREREIDIIRDHANIADPNLKKVILDFFDPYSASGNKRIETFACFAGFEYEMFEQLKSEHRDKVEPAFLKTFSEQFEAKCKMFEDRLKSSSASSHHFRLLLLPFPNLDDLRKAFLLKLGVTQ